MAVYQRNIPCGARGGARKKLHKIQHGALNRQQAACATGEREQGLIGDKRISVFYMPLDGNVCIDLLNGLIYPSFTAKYAVFSSDHRGVCLLILGY